MNKAFYIRLILNILIAVILKELLGFELAVLILISWSATDIDEIIKKVK